MSERAFVFLSGDAGNDANDGLSEDYPVQTYAVAEGKGDRAINISYSHYGIRENININTGKWVSLIGRARIDNDLGYTISGAADANPAITLSNSERFSSNICGLNFQNFNCKLFTSCVREASINFVSCIFLSFLVIVDISFPVATANSFAVNSL